MKRLPILLSCLLGVFALPASAQVLDRSINRAGASVLELEAGGAAIVLTPSSDLATVRVRVDQDKSAPVPAMQSVRQGNRLSVTLKPASGAPLLPFVQSNAATYAVSYPANMRLDLRLSNGDVSISKPSASIEIYNQDGNISIDDPRASITAENGHGNITVTGALGPIDLAADDGNVDATLASGWSGNEIRMQSATGTVRLTVPKNFRAKFDVSSDTGVVHNSFGASNARSPFVWLYALKGDVWLTPSKS
ncbi:MAG TPA: DUF4097 family beta strand repeat-containing protein [Candidatus Baltobacteraceae bacterium]|jgi:hypothetical protein|nr:DUF4097 family beta strand repeat-containing protein [Candidatus Baltobacteraceae bacterium]